MGLRRVSSSTRPGGPFRWHHDGSILNMASDYQNWGTEGPPWKRDWPQPDGTGDCVHIGHPRTGQWNDHYCHMRFYYICKKRTRRLKLNIIVSVAHHTSKLDYPSLSGCVGVWCVCVCLCVCVCVCVCPETRNFNMLHPIKTSEV